MSDLAPGTTAPLPVAGRPCLFVAGFFDNTPGPPLPSVLSTFFAPPAQAPLAPAAPPPPAPALPPWSRPRVSSPPAGPPPPPRAGRPPPRPRAGRRTVGVFRLALPLFFVAGVSSSAGPPPQS